MPLVTIVVLGGTGTVGRHIVRALGDRARPASRATGVDLTTGAGVAEALEGAEAVVDATNGPPNAKARPVLVDGTRRLLEAGAAAGVRHHVCVSINGIDRVGLAYYKVKREQERLVEDGPVPWTIVRATQFHELLDFLLGKPLFPFGRLPLQTAAAREVGAAIADVAVGEPRRVRLIVAGPQRRTAGEMARTRREIRGSAARALPLPAPGAAGRGALTAAAPDVRTTTTYEQWLRGGT